MNAFRKHWFDIGGVLALLTALYVYKGHHRFTTLQLILWLHLLSLFLHQLEEYRFPGYFPGMLNAVLYKSTRPDRYPLNTQTAVVVNVGFGWTSYFLAALTARELIWPGIAVMMISLGNVIAHTVLFNVKGRTLYNPGMATALLLFLPLLLWFTTYVVSRNAATHTDWFFGVLCGLLLNGIGVFKMISWMADKNTPFIFESRQLGTAIRKRI